MAKDWEKKTETPQGGPKYPGVIPPRQPDRKPEERPKPTDRPRK